MTSYSSHRTSVSTLGAMALALFLSSQAEAAQTFTGSLTAGGSSATYSITTDSTIGTLTDSNITAWNVFITDGVTTDSYSNLFGHLFIGGTSLSATATDLLFNYSLSGVNYVTFYNPSYSNYMDFQTNDGFSDRSTIRLGGGTSFAAQAGQQVIASVDQISAVPEPGIWAMMLLGFGGIGASLRRRARVRLYQAA